MRCKCFYIKLLLSTYINTVWKEIKLAVLWAYNFAAELILFPYKRHYQHTRYKRMDKIKYAWHFYAIEVNINKEVKETLIG